MFFSTFQITIFTYAKLMFFFNIPNQNNFYHVLNQKHYIFQTHSESKAFLHIPKQSHFTHSEPRAYLHSATQRHFYTVQIKSFLKYSKSSLEQALQQLQDAFQDLQRSLLQLKLVLISNKTKYMIFSRGRTKVTDLTITTLNGTFIERVSSY